VLKSSRPEGMRKFYFCPFFLEVKKVIKIPRPNPINVNAGMAAENSSTKSNPIPMPMNKQAGMGHLLISCFFFIFFHLSLFFPPVTINAIPITINAAPSPAFTEAMNTIPTPKKVIPEKNIAL